MGWMNLSTLNIDIFLDSLAKFYVSLPTSLKQVGKEEVIGDTLHFRFKSYSFSLTSDHLINLLDLNFGELPLSFQ